MNFKTETGRSMVEMLGTLAIIGVLSIGGVVGYSYGMDKYRCNKTINDIMLRSINMINQLSSGKTPDLSEWEKEETFYPIEVERNNSLGQYAIVVKNVPSRVCKMIGDSLKGQMDIYVGSETLAESATATDPCDESEQNIMEFYFNAVSCNPACSEDEYCENGICFKTDKIPFNPEYDCGYFGMSCETNDGQQGICKKEGCEPIGTCTSNDDCTEKGEFCAAVDSGDHTSCWSRFPSGRMGTCTKETLHRFEFNDKIYYFTNPFMSWWNGEWICQKLGKEMIGVDDLVKDFKDVADTYELTDFAKHAIANLGANAWIWTKDEEGDTDLYWILYSASGSIGHQCKRNRYTVICK